MWKTILIRIKKYCEKLERKIVDIVIDFKLFIKTKIQSSSRIVSEWFCA